MIIVKRMTRNDEFEKASYADNPIGLPKKLASVMGIERDKLCPKCNGNRGDMPCAYPESCWYAVDI